MTGATDADIRLRRLLGGEPTAWLVRRARDRLEAGRPLTGTVTLTDVSVEQRRAVERLTGRPARSGASLSVSLSHCLPGHVFAGPVRVCENPVVVAAAADELGSRCQPLVCVGGQPSAAAWRLLDLLAAGGAEFGYHGDFDWGGIRIASAVRTRISGRQARWRSWRYDGDAMKPWRGRWRPRPRSRGCPGWPASRSRHHGTRRS